ncbi:MAG: tetratricopeptide repeat protein [Gammaproteobacteria bacterium]|nr:tetratricopeptide repeat protein [Gammaproteobacteria bacterium]
MLIVPALCFGTGVSAAAALKTTPVSQEAVAWEGIKSPLLRAAQFELLMRRPVAAITRLLADQSQGYFARHPAQARLVLGGIYLAYGAHYKAESIFQGLTIAEQPQGLRDMARYQLARLQFQRGQPDEALDSLGRIDGELPAKMQQERMLLSSLLFLQDDQFDEAEDNLRSMEHQAQRDDSDATSTWAAYGRFNLGVTLFRQGREQEGRKLLEAVGKMPADNSEIRALRDKANLTLAFSYLGLNEPDAAQKYFAKTRLEGPLSNKALLGLGRAYAARGEYKKALTPWMQLTKRDASDPSVQDGLLAVPFAFGKLEALKQSLGYYQSALNVYQQEMKQVHTAEAAVNNRALLDSLVRGVSSEALKQRWFLADLSDVPGARYLWPLFSTHEFQETLKNYTRIYRSRDTLTHWSARLGSGDIDPQLRRSLQDRIDALEKKLSTTQQRLGTHLTQLALMELNRRKQRLVSYAAEVRFSMAQIYDYAAKRWGGE